METRMMDSSLAIAPSGVARASGSVALAAVFIALAALVVAHVRERSLVWWRNPVSQYGISPSAVFYRIQTLSMAVAALALVVGLHSGLRRGGVGEVEVLLIVFALARGLISWFPMDVPGGDRTATGRNHGVLAIVAFVSLGLAANSLSRVVSGLTTAQWWSDASHVLSIVLAVALLAMLLARRVPLLHHYFGLVERTFYLAAIAWLVVTAWALIVVR
jgi:hypothetical protein